MNDVDYATLDAAIKVLRRESTQRSAAKPGPTESFYNGLIAARCQTVAAGIETLLASLYGYDGDVRATELLQDKGDR